MKPPLTLKKIPGSRGNTGDVSCEGAEGTQDHLATRPQEPLDTARRSPFTMTGAAQALHTTEGTVLPSITGRIPRLTTPTSRVPRQTMGASYRPTTRWRHHGCLTTTTTRRCPIATTLPIRTTRLKPKRQRSEPTPKRRPRGLWRRHRQRLASTPST